MSLTHKHKGHLFDDSKITLLEILIYYFEICFSELLNSRPEMLKLLPILFLTIFFGCKLSNHPNSIKEKSNLKIDTVINYDCLRITAKENGLVKFQKIVRLKEPWSNKKVHHDFDQYDINFYNRKGKIYKRQVFRTFEGDSSFVYVWNTGNVIFEIDSSFANSEMKNGKKYLWRAVEYFYYKDMSENEDDFSIKWWRCGEDCSEFSIQLNNKCYENRFSRSSISYSSGYKKINKKTFYSAYSKILRIKNQTLKKLKQDIQNETLDDFEIRLFKNIK